MPYNFVLQLVSFSCALAFIQMTNLPIIEPINCILNDYGTSRINRAAYRQPENLCAFFNRLQNRIRFTISSRIWHTETTSVKGSIFLGVFRFMVSPTWQQTCTCLTAVTMTKNWRMVVWPIDGSLHIFDSAWHKHMMEMWRTARKRLTGICGPSPDNTGKRQTMLVNQLSVRHKSQWVTCGYAINQPPMTCESNTNTMW